MRWLLPVLLLLAGCASDSITLPKAPQWVSVPSATYDAVALTQVVHAVAPQAYVEFTDTRYTLVSANWVRSYTDWTWQAAKAVGLRYRAESFDCEDFAALFKEIAAKKAADAGVVAAPLIAKVTVVLPEGLHAIVGVATDEGLFLIEPQPDAGPFRITPLAKFTGKITRVDL